MKELMIEPDPEVAQELIEFYKRLNNNEKVIFQPSLFLIDERKKYILTESIRTGTSLAEVLEW